jgi:polyphosphate kinase 2 (PPK2 family)
VSALPKNDIKLVEGEHYSVLRNGCLRLTRKYPCLSAGYEKESIPDFLSLIDHKLALGEEDYKRQLDIEEERLNELVRQLHEKKMALIIVFQGRDGAGKSGATERILEAVDYDMEIFDAIHIGPPTDEELAHPFLWRFSMYQRLPRWGEVRVFDRSWYERLLVEPVMGITKGAELKQSYGQIRSWEWTWASSGYVICKFWLDITKEEQAARFKKREKKKPWKLSPYDAAARKLWDDYTVAANEMFHRTATTFAPWYLVSSEDKYYSRVTVLQVINQVLKEHLG